LRHSVVAEESILLVAEVMPLEVGIGPNDSAAAGRGFQTRRFSGRGHVEADWFGYDGEKLPFGIEWIRLGEHPAVQPHFGNMAVCTSDLFEESLAVFSRLAPHRIVRHDAAGSSELCLKQ